MVTFSVFSQIFKNILLTEPLKLQCRNTFILKRKYELPLQKLYQKKYVASSDEDHHVYEMIEDTNVRKRPLLELVLTEFVEDVGKRGQLVSVHHSYGYNFLILTGRAVYPTPENIAKQKLLSEDDLDKHSTISAYKTMKILCKTTVPVLLHMKTPWTIEPWHIRVAFRNAGIHILKDECIELPEKPIVGPNLDLEGNDFAVIITINNLEKTAVRCRIRHWTEKFSDRITLSERSNNAISKPIFPEQEELLDSIAVSQSDYVPTFK